jgi:response regulator RpfG family c-di-GMP phosphodiesterase
MSQPVLFVIDDDAGAVHALRDDLDRPFGEDFRVIGESSARAGLTTLRKLADEHASVAVLIVDHDMSEIPGVDFLARAHEMHPLDRDAYSFLRCGSGRGIPCPVPPSEVGTWPVVPRNAIRTRLRRRATRRP